MCYSSIAEISLSVKLKGNTFEKKETGLTSDGEILELDSEWNNIKDEYEIIESLGSGSYGQVMRCRHVKTGTDVAIKLIRNCFNSVYDMKKVVSEIQIMRKLTECEENCHTTRIFDVITSKINHKDTEPI